MAIFTNSNRITGDYDELDAATGYEGSVGASQMFIESVQNDLVLFEALLTNDFREVGLLNESAGYEEIEALLEASAVGFIERIKEYLKKAWEKIKALVEAFMANLMNVVVRDNKKFVEKYKTDVLKKDLSKMKYKWSTLKRNATGIFEDDLATVSTDVVDGLAKERLSDVNAKFIDDVNSSSYKEDLYKDRIGVYGSQSEILKYIKEKSYNDKDTHTGLSDGLRNNIMETLETSGKLLKTLKDLKGKIDKIYKQRFSELDRYKNQVASRKDGESTEVDGQQYGKSMPSDDIMKKLNALYKHCQIEQDVARDSISVTISLAKFKIKECRAVFARAASFNSNLVKETDDDLLDGEDEAEEHELEEAFEGIYAY